MNQQASEQSFIQHLLELRSRLLKAVAGTLIIFLVLVGFSNPIYNFVSTPLLQALPDGGKMIATSVISPFLVPIKLSLWISFFISVPWILYQLWAFVAPGLYQHERRIVYPIFISSVLLFYTGILFAYYVVLPPMFGFMVKTTPVNVEMLTDIGQYLSLVLRVFLAFGIAFEVPVVIIILVIMNVVSTKKIVTLRPYIIIGAFILGAVLTPPDIFSQIFFAIAVLILFEIGLFFARYLEKAKKKNSLDKETE